MTSKNFPRVNNDIWPRGTKVETAEGPKITGTVFKDFGNSPEIQPLYIGQVCIITSYGELFQLPKSGFKLVEEN